MPDAETTPLPAEAPVHTDALIEIDGHARAIGRWKSAAEKLRKQRLAIANLGERPRGVAPGINLDHPPKYIESCHVDVHIQVCDYDQCNISTHSLDNYNLQNFLEIERPAHSKVRWINCKGISFDVIKILGLHYDIHPLVLEDIFHLPQRTKVDMFEEHIFISMMLLSLRDQQWQFESDQTFLFSGHQQLLQKVGGSARSLKLFPRPAAEREQCYFFLLNDGVVLSIFQHSGEGIMEQLNGQLENQKKNSLLRRTCDPSFLLHGLIDGVVDRYFKIVQFYEMQLSQLQDAAILRPQVTFTRTLHMVSKELSLLDRAIRPTENVVNHLSHQQDYATYIGSSSGEAPLNRYRITTLTHTYLRDVGDHIHFILNSFESFKETSQGLIDLTFNSISHSTNESMKILAVSSLIFLPLSLLAGIYGMNFDYFPEIHLPYGFIHFWYLAFMSLVITLYFSWKMRWLAVQE